MVRYDDINPQVIRVGQLVEAQVTFSAVRDKGTKYNFIRRLRSICILDRTYQFVSVKIYPYSIHHNVLQENMPSLRHPIQLQPSVVRMKRKIGYENIVSKKQKMDVDTNNGDKE